MGHSSISIGSANNQSIDPLLMDLNSTQIEAVTSDAQHLLILAGAGTGKTRVLVHRIAWLCLKLNYASKSIFAVTFTNKAAHEMSQRIKHQMGEGDLNNMWIGTFHGLAHRLLRIFYQAAKLPIHFQLIDVDDQYRLVKSVLKSFNIDEKQVSHKEAAHFISDQKEKGNRPNHLELTDTKSKMLHKIYVEYQIICDRLGYVDFSELLLRTYETLNADESMRQYCRTRFTNILVDEFQDTNAIQYKLIRLLAGKTGNILIVGDDDQAIYSWRGATPDNLLRFKEDYADTEVIRLEQNYRSMPEILNAANSLIQHNTKRLGKNLWTESKSTQKVRLIQAFNTLEEARLVISAIQSLYQNGATYDECAILYRNNFQAHFFENALMQNKMPYKIYGAIRFYERSEVKLALSYLRLLYNSDNNLAFEQIINTPVRGIGSVTLEKLRLNAQQKNVSLWQASVEALNSDVFTLRQKSTLARFVELMGSLFDEIVDLPLPQQIEKVIHTSGLYAMFEAEESIKGTSKLENLEDLITNAEQYFLLKTKQLETNQAQNEILDEQTHLSILDEFLAYTSLEGQDNRTEPGVQLMTLHGSKGLEFDYVFIVGFEDGLFPSERSLIETDRLEEERRLAYVGITRARKELTLSFCENRRVFNEEKRYAPSRFLFEIDETTLDHSLASLTAPKKAYREVKQDDFLQNTFLDKSLLEKQRAQFEKSKQKQNDYPLGTKVIHPRFGEGTVINQEGEGDHLRLQIAFNDNGIKWLVVKMTQLTLKNMS